MIKSFWLKISQDWSVMRFLRLFLALSVVIQSFTAGDFLFMGLGALLVLQTLLVAGCGFGTSACGVAESKESQSITIPTVEYEEISGK